MTDIEKAIELIEIIRDWKLPQSGVFYPNSDGSTSDRPAPYDSAYANGSKGAEEFIRNKAKEALALLKNIPVLDADPAKVTSGDTQDVGANNRFESCDGSQESLPADGDLNAPPNVRGEPVGNEGLPKAGGD